MSTAYLFKLVVTDGANAGDSNQANASTSPYGTISGTVRDAEGNPLAGVGISGFVASGPSNPIGGAISGADGSYSILNVPVGTGRYAFSSKQNYIVADVYNIPVNPGVTTTVDFVVKKILATGYPMVGAAQAAGSKMIRIQVKANGDSTTAYYVVVPDGATAPSSSQIQTGKDSANVAALYAAGIISGYNDQRFGPDDPITREQMAVIIVKAARLPNSTAQLNFTDSKKISAWAKEAVAQQFISGYPDNTFRPAEKATRAEAVSVINRIK